MVCENHILHSVKATGLLTANQKFIIHFPITNHIRILTILRDLINNINQKPEPNLP